MAAVSFTQTPSPDSLSFGLANEALGYIQSMREYLRTERFDPKRWPAGGYRGLYAFEVKIIKPVEQCYLWIQIHLQPVTAAEFRTRLDHVLKRWDKWLLTAQSAYGNLGQSEDHEAWLAEHPDLRDELKGFREELHSVHDYLYGLEGEIRERIKPTEKDASESPDAGAEKRPPTIPAGCTHTEDFSSVCWYGEPFHFNRTEAKCVRLLWAEWEKNPDGCMALRQDTIRNGIESESETFRLVFVFRHDGKPQPAWGRMIHALGDGRFYLAKPQKKTPAAKRKSAKKARIT